LRKLSGGARRGDRLFLLLLAGHNQEEVVEPANVDLAIPLAKEYLINHKDQIGDQATEPQPEDKLINHYQVSDEEAPSVVVIQQLLDHGQHNLNPNPDLFLQKTPELDQFPLKLVLLVPVLVSPPPNSHPVMAQLDHHSHMHLSAGRPFQRTGRASLHFGSVDSKITVTISTGTHSPSSSHGK
jgi:hypothetical protein